MAVALIRFFEWCLMKEMVNYAVWIKRPARYWLATTIASLIGLLPLYSKAEEQGDLTALAISARDLGHPEEALSLWTKAADLSPTDGFLLNQKGWAFLALGHIREAKKSFAKAAELSSNTAMLVEANFGTGMAQALDSDNGAAAKTFQSVCTQSPYLYPIGADWMAKIALKKGKKQVAELYLKQSLDQDPFHPDALDEIAALYMHDGLLREAWQKYHMALGLNPFDLKALEGAKKIEETLHLSREKLSGARKIYTPLLQKPFTPPPSTTLRVGLYADSKGKLAQIQKFLFASGVEFKILKNGAETASGHPNEHWETSWDFESRIIEVRDSSHKLRYAGRDTIRIEPQTSGAGVLVQGISLERPEQQDLNDREFRGSLELRPSASGFFMINEIPAEEYLYSQVAAYSPSDAPAEELKAQAVVSRTALGELKRKFSQSDLGIDLCDSSYCQLYVGLSQERSDATQAVVVTAGQLLYPVSGKFEALQHAHCGGITADGIVDSSTATASIRSPEALERFLHSDPSKEDFCNISHSIPSNWSRWVRVLDAARVVEAVSDRAHLGKIQTIEVVSRSPAGRITALKLAGSEGQAVLQDDNALAAIFLRLGLRSSLFSIQPLYRGKEIDQVVIWGAGSGGGHGMCVAGALGQAYIGRSYKEILHHYFPGAEIR